MFYSVKEITEKNKSKIYESLMEFIWEYEELGHTRRVNEDGLYLSDKIEEYLLDLKNKKLIDNFDIIDSSLESVPDRDVGIISVCYSYSVPYTYERKMEHFIVDWEN